MADNLDKVKEYKRFLLAQMAAESYLDALPGEKNLRRGPSHLMAMGRLMITPTMTPTHLQADWPLVPIIMIPNMILIFVTMLIPKMK